MAAAGEFLDGAAMISEERVQQALRLMRTRRLAAVTLEIAEHYARISSILHRARTIAGRSHNDLWIAATSRSHGARLLTRNPSDFAGISGLEIISYG